MAAQWVESWFKKTPTIKSHQKKLGEANTLIQKQIEKLQEQNYVFQKNAEEAVENGNDTKAKQFLNQKKQNDQNIKILLAKISVVSKREQMFVNLVTNQMIAGTLKESRDLLDEQIKNAGLEDFGDVMSDLNEQDDEQNEVDKEFLFQAEKDQEKNNFDSEETDDELAKMKAASALKKQQKMDEEFIAARTPSDHPRTSKQRQTESSSSTSNNNNTRRQNSNSQFERAESEQSSSTRNSAPRKNVSQITNEQEIEEFQRWKAMQQKNANSIKSSEFPSTPNNAPQYAAPAAPEKQSENTYGQIRNKQGKQSKKPADEDEDDLTFDVE